MEKCRGTVGGKGPADSEARFYGELRSVAEHVVFHDRKAKKRRTGTGLLRGALHVRLDFMAFTAEAMRPAGLFFVLKGFLLEQPRRLRLASGDTQLLRDTRRLDDLADLSASAVLSAG